MTQPSRTDLLAVIFLVGFSSLVYEIYSVRILFMFFTKSTQATSLAISSFLAGIAFSSLFFARFAKTKSQNLNIIFWLQLAAAFYGYCVLAHYSVIPQFIDSLITSGISDNVANAVEVGIFWVFLFVPAFFMGGAFPLISGIYIQSLDSTSKDTGDVYFWDTMGAILGALLAGYLFIPRLGLEITLLIAAIINLCCCLMLQRRKIIQSATLGVMLALVTGEATHLGYMDFGIDWRSEEQKLASRFGSVRFQKESPYGTVTVTDSDQPRLFINYREMCVGDINSASESAIGRIPIQALEGNLAVLNIGLGCGITAANILRNGQIDTLDIAEINPVILDATSTYFSIFNDDVTRQPNVRMVIEEGYHFLRNSQKRYDAIIVDVEEPTIVQSSALYTQEFFNAAEDHLSGKGIFALWSFSSTPEFTRVIYNTLKSVFRHVTLQRFDSSTVYYASNQAYSALLKINADDYVQQLLEIPTQELNTLKEPNAEKYYDLNAVFSLPQDYQDNYSTK